MPVVLTVFIVLFCYHYKIYVWNGKFYSDMLTALITALSIIISIFGILIPLLMTAKQEKELTKYFFENVDIKYFIRCIKQLFLSGFISIMFVCGMYAYDVIEMKVFIVVGVLSIVVILYFLCSAYRYISLMLRLLFDENEKHNRNIKIYKNKMSNIERESLNRRLKERDKQ